MDTLMADLATNLPTLRSRHALSIRDVSEEIPMDPGYLSHLENTSRKNVSLQTLHAIAEFYAVSVSMLLTKGGADV